MNLFFNKRFIVTFFFALLIIFLILFRNTLIGDRESQKNTAEYYDPYPKLLSRNADFSTAERLRREGDNEAAASYYQKALPLAGDKNEEYQIKYLMALSRSRTAQIGEGIEELKGIAANPAYSTKQHAYAVQAIGELFYKNLDNSSIVSFIFSGEPYAQFYKEKDIQLALRRLYEYSISFYPMALAEMRAARWYSMDLIRLSKKKSLTADELKRWDADAAFVQDALAKADENIERTSNVQSASLIIPDALTRKAQVLGDLSIAGISAADPEIAFKQAIAAGLLNGNDVSPRHAYAEYLAQAFGASRATDIINNLSIIYTNVEKNVGYKNFWLAERSDMTGKKKTIVQFASIDPQFKKVLLSLGWTEKDFR